jgi:hypothetical protein
MLIKEKECRKADVKEVERYIANGGGGVGRKHP